LVAPPARHVHGRVAGVVGPVEVPLPQKVRDAGHVVGGGGALDGGVLHGVNLDAVHLLQAPDVVHPVGHRKAPVLRNLIEVLLQLGGRRFSFILRFHWSTQKAFTCRSQRNSKSSYIPG